MYRNRREFQKKIIVTEEMVNCFIKTVRDTIKDSECLFDRPDDFHIEESVFLCTSDGTVYGCTDGDLFLLDSKFFYERFYKNWCLSQVYDCVRTEAPKHDDFYTKLYYKNVLSHRNYGRTSALSNLRIYYDKPQSFFVIQATDLGIYDGIRMKLFF